MDASNPPVTLMQAVRYFADADRALAFMVAVRWPDGNVECPTCGSKEVTFLSTRRVWKCSQVHARQQFSIKIGTVLEDSPLGLDKWLPAIWLIVNCKNGISSHELARDLKVTQKSAWFMLHRIRLAMQAKTFNKLGGRGKIVEADETWIGAKARMMNNKQRAKSKRFENASGPYAYDGKTIVAGVLERGGRIRVSVVPDVKGKTLRPLVRKNVEKGSELHTDENDAYKSVANISTADFIKEGHTFGDYPVDYFHKVVNHTVEYVRGNVHTNGVENFWSLLKRGIRGTYVSVEPFHLFRYLDEQAFRFNERKHELGDGGRFVTALRQIVGRRLTYKNLIGMQPALAPQ
jgi:transposase-like protein